MDANVLTLKKLEALKELGDGRATKIIVPTDLAQSASDLSYISEMLGMPSSKEVDIEEKTKKVEVKEDACCDSDERSPITKEVKGDLPLLPGENE